MQTLFRSIGTLQHLTGPDDGPGTAKQALRVEVAESRTVASAMIGKTLRRHHQIPVSVSSDGSVASKTRALGHAFFAEAKSREETVRRTHQVVSMTTDRGAEFALTEQHGSVQDWMAAWLRSKPEPEADIHGPADAGQQVPDGYVLPRTLQVGGACHLFHNIEAGMDSKVLTQYGAYLKSLRALSTFLKRPDLRVVWKERLLKGTAMECVMFMLDADPPKHASWRWGTISKLLAWLCERELLLRRSWNARRFAAGGSVDDALFDLRDEHTGEKSRVDLGTLSRIFADEFFWRYTHLLELMHGVTKRAMGWSEGCLCHGGFETLGEAQNVAYTACLRSLGNRASDDGVGYNGVCMMAGKRAWEVSVGIFEDLLKGWMHDAESQLYETFTGLPGVILSCLEIGWAHACSV